MSHLDLEPFEYDTYTKARIRKLRRWYKKLRYDDRKKINDFLITIKLRIADMKDERKKNG